ncbi:hypothetical protein K1Y78_45900 [Streptomyces sp. tea 10]|nr:hypothetical protein [Streptomyces sp. tea 10]
MGRARPQTALSVGPAVGVAAASALLGAGTGPALLVLAAGPALGVLPACASSGAARGVASVTPTVEDHLRHTVSARR